MTVIVRDGLNLILILVGGDASKIEPEGGFRTRSVGAWSMDFLDPRGEPSRPLDDYTQTATLDAGQTIGLFANGFPDSVAFLQHIEKALSHHLPGVNFTHYDKGNASALASDEHLSSIAETCSAVVAAYGH